MLAKTDTENKRVGFAHVYDCVAAEVVTLWRWLSWRQAGAS